MKKTSLILVLMAASIFINGCAKDLLKKKDAETPADNYTGTWLGVNAALDANGNNTIDANEIAGLNGSTELKLNTGNSFSFSINNGGNNVQMSGNWTVSPDAKSVTITDPAQGTVRFDYRSATELQTEPVATANGTVWIIYRKQ
jgi:hypothetical protein